MRCRDGAHKRPHFGVGLIAAVLALFATVAAAVPTRDLSPPQPADVRDVEPRGQIAGKVTWDGAPLDGVIVYLYSDPTLKSVHSASPLLADTGVFSIDVAPGTYYVAAILDRNRSGGLDVGDALGIHGIRSWGDTSERKLPVNVGPNQRASNVNVAISAIRARRGARDSMISVADALAAELSPPTRTPTAAIRGSVKGITPNTTGAPSTHVFAYADLGWRHLLDGSPVAPDGSFELRVPAGKAYVAAITDNNGSNVFDAGDTFGFFSRMDPRPGGSGRALPAPIAVRDGDVREGVDLTLVGKRDARGGLVALDADPQAPTQAEARVITGRVDWPNHPPARATVEFYADASLLAPTATVGAGPTGEFTARLTEGDYYIIANVDADGDGVISSGDGIGGHGSSDITSFPPRPYAVAENAMDLVITVTGAFNDAGLLLPVASDATATTAIEEYNVAAGIMGRIQWDGHAPKEAWILVSHASDFADAEMRPIVLDSFGNFVVALAPGPYYIMGIVDATADEQVGPGDGVAIYGARVGAVDGEIQPSRVYVWENRVTPYVHLSVSAVYTDQGGRYAALDDGSRGAIRRSLGEPNDRYRWNENGRLVEEWRYWSEGVAFTFAANGPGWTQIGTEEFTPNRAAIERMRPDDIGMTPSLVAQSTVDAVIYYEAEGVVWAFTPEGAQRPITVGSQPRATPDGLLYRDQDGSLMLLDGESDTAALAMPADSGARDLAFAPDNASLAYIQDDRLVVRRRNGQEQVAPVGAMVGLAAPAWDRRSRVVAFSAVNPSGGGMAIYAYDPEQSHVEPLIVRTGDDVQPAWSPTDARVLAYTHVVDDVGQIWVTTFSELGERSSTQVTETGGSGAQWLPDGSGLVYEADGQIWTVDIGSKAARPLLVNGAPIIGGRPMVVPMQP